ncbi:MAG: DUF2238 domain-containing protein [Planctomycetes bacterium]|nr:DUF2238 domain-containing protein [Planctomycetota bacterium]
MIGAPLLVATRRRWPATPLLYFLLFLHGLVLMVGGRYSYAEVPAGFWARDLLGFERNPYDRLGHLAQGFVPALLAREVLRGFTPLRGGWLAFQAGCCALAFSAFYELVEWWAALAFGAGAEAFLGTQGDEWDTQWDMFLALVGASASLALLGRVHERQVLRRGPWPGSAACASAS